VHGVQHLKQVVRDDAQKRHNGQAVATMDPGAVVFLPLDVQSPEAVVLDAPVGSDWYLGHVELDLLDLYLHIFQGNQDMLLQLGQGLSGIQSVVHPARLRNHRVQSGFDFLAARNDQSPVVG
jgi:hypothetical protein